jgi:hypothetical protein
VHGPDDRVQISNTSVYPWRVHASLLITAADGSRWIGTGWFIGPHTLMTAGHVVYIKNSGVPVCPRSRSSSRAWSAVLPASKWRRPACSSPEASCGVGRRAPHRCGSRRHSGHRPWKHRGMVRLRRLAGRGPAVCRCQHLRLSRYEVACVAEGYAPSSTTLQVTDDRDLRVEVRLTANGPGR